MYVRDYSEDVSYPPFSNIVLHSAPNGFGHCNCAGILDLRTTAQAKSHMCGKCADQHLESHVLAHGERAKNVNA